MAFMKTLRYLTGLIVMAIILFLTYRYGHKSLPAMTGPVRSLPATPAQSSTSTPSLPAFSPNLQPPLALPINNAMTRVTKKPFGIYITPKTSPVQPERFTGFHTGADFETIPAEQKIDVPIYAICDGKLLMKKYASGYGGVAVESCTIDSNPVTVIYGHLRLASVKPNPGDKLDAGEQIAVLGTGYSSETDGERKHLHLGIHKGSAIDILGYVQKQTDLNGWIDPLSVLK